MAVLYFFSGQELANECDKLIRLSTFFANSRHKNQYILDPDLIYSKQSIKLKSLIYEWNAFRCLLFSILY